MDNPLVKNLILPIEGHIVYSVDELGNIYSHKSSGVRKLSQQMHKARGAKPYLRARVGKKVYLVHRLMMAGKIGRFLTTDEHVNHKNGNTQDNRLENLEIVSHKENVKHAVINKLYCSGDEWHKARSRD
jgi:hypothetical protein